jgi:hypothetical protein
MMDIDIKEIRELAKRFTPEQIEGCISDQIVKGQNVCMRTEDAEKTINELAKTEYIRNLVDGGMSLADALRELARRMRLMQKGYEKWT